MESSSDHEIEVNASINGVESESTIVTVTDSAGSSLIPAVQIDGDTFSGIMHYKQQQLTIDTEYESLTSDKSLEW